MYNDDAFGDPEEFYSNEMCSDQDIEEEIDRDLAMGGFIKQLGMVRRTIMLMCTGHLRPKNYKDRWPANAQRTGVYTGNTFYGKPWSAQVIWRHMRDINKLAAKYAIAKPTEDVDVAAASSNAPTSRIPFANEIMAMAKKQARKSGYLDENDLFQEAVGKLLDTGSRRLAELNKEMVLLISHGAMVDYRRREKRHE